MQGNTDITHNSKIEVGANSVQVTKMMLGKQ